jgi:hypothetical protein
MKVGDWVRITKPLPEYKGLYKLKNRVGKISKVFSENFYSVHFKEENQDYSFFRREITKLPKDESFLEEL